MPAHVYVHPRCFGRRAVEIAIADSQGSRIERDARGRPFIVAADRLAPPEAPPEAPAEDEPGMVPEPERERLARLIWAFIAEWQR
jgi:hypothetical protein